MLREPPLCNNQSVRVVAPSNRDDKGVANAVTLLPTATNQRVDMC